MENKTVKHIPNKLSMSRNKREGRYRYKRKGRFVRTPRVVRNCVCVFPPSSGVIINKFNGGYRY